ncbi:serpin family protein [Paenibacillus sp. KR2-11]|uniref:serpin family protein n=1 Tax=Paenibacillus sp. KR2-11 TaxID=3385500 RepID=UPI0038FCC492
MPVKKTRTYTLTRSLLILMSAALLLAGCGQDGDRRAEAAVEKRSHSLEELDGRIAAGHNTFGLRLHRRLAEEHPGENVFLSPYSVAAALSMVYHGAEGDTRSEIGRVLHAADLPLDEWNKGSLILKDLLEHSGEAVRLDVANSVWSRKGIPLRESFLERNRESYGAEVKELDFSEPKAARTINDWVKKNTGGRIPAIVDDPIPGSILMYLINAVYFNGRWSDPFEKKDTVQGEFHPTPDGPALSVPLMHGGGSYPYLRENGYQAVRLPYEGGRLHMLIVLPDEGTTLGEVQEKLWTDPGFWRREMPPLPGTLELPRFRLEGDYDLNDALSALGMPGAFDPLKANFQGVSDMPLSISKLKHKTFLKVDEEGTEAAAVTSIGMAGSAPPQDEPFHMIVNRPFLLAIQSAETGSLLFLGSIYKPQE